MNMIFGLHAVFSALESSMTRVREIAYLQEGKNPKLQALLTQAKQQGVLLKSIDKSQLDKLSQGGNHQGVIAFVEKIKHWDESDLQGLIQQAKQRQKPLRVLILDGVQDPHNLGACLRSADAFGVLAVIIPKDKSCSVTPVVEKVACGAAQTVPVIPVTNLARTLKELKDEDFWLVGFAGEVSETLDQLELDKNLNIGIVMGAEGSGLRRLTKEHCDYLVKIPMIGTVESLNVSVATGIALYVLKV